MPATAGLPALRRQYRDYQVLSGYTRPAFRRRCEEALAARGMAKTPENWVTVALDVCEEAQGDHDDECYEGYLGTGMSEAAYFTALGSAEFL